MIALVEPIAVKVRECAPRLLALLLADRPLTQAEWAEIALVEEEAA
ncbi:hypothetical protein [Sphingomonas sp. GB1N7]